MQSPGLVFGKGEHEVKLENLHHQHLGLVPTHLIYVKTEQAIELELLAALILRGFGSSVFPLKHQLMELLALFELKVSFKIGQLLAQNHLKLGEARVPEKGKVQETA